MVMGTAGFAAALSLHLLTEHGLRPGDGPVLVTGASGGVGSTAVAMLAAAGYEVVASTGSADAAGWLRDLGATEVIDRSETADTPRRPLESQRWAGAVDAVGGPTLAHVLATLRVGAAVAASGNVAGVGLDTTVLPFILRGVALYGVDTAHASVDLKRTVWDRVAGQWRPRSFDDLVAGEIGLGDLDKTLDAIIEGRIRGRTLVDPGR
jgi:acrylyl-CoA reductase (NADPH)